MASSPSCCIITAGYPSNSYGEIDLNDIYISVAMPFEREWDSSCPRVYDRWETDGVSWVIQDLPPEDDEIAVQLLMEHLVPDETMCVSSGIQDDPVSASSLADIWRHYTKQRMSLACYAEKEGTRVLIAFNCCTVKCQSEEDNEGKYDKVEGGACRNLFTALEYIEKKCDCFEYLGLNQYLFALGLVVRRDYRGSKLGVKVLNAREPLALSHGVKGTATIFTGPASQKCAKGAGFETIAEVTYQELADLGLKYPQDNRIVKVMVKKYVK